MRLLQDTLRHSHPLPVVRLTGLIHQDEINQAASWGCSDTSSRYRAQHSLWVALDTTGSSCGLAITPSSLCRQPYHPP